MSACGEPATTPAADSAATADSGQSDGQLADIGTTDTAAGGADGTLTDTNSGPGTDTNSGPGTDTSSGAGDAPLSADGADAGVGKYATCSALSQCISDKCSPPTTGCESSCLAQAAGDSTGKALPMLNCYQTKCLNEMCKGSTDAKCANDCFKTGCLSELFICLDDSKVGSKACDSISGCFDSCPLGKPDTFACMGKCFNDLDANGKKIANALGACFAKNPGPDPTQKCAAETVACFVGEKTGTSPCYSVFNCAAACKKAGKGDDMSCSLGCLGTVTKGGQKAFLDLMGCFGDNSGTMTPECAGKFLACADPIGTADCLAGMSLLAKCQKAAEDGDNPTCMFKALHGMTKEAATTFLQLTPCFGKNDPGSVKTCSPIFMQCVNPTGSADCGLTVTCMQKCPKDDSMCMFGCLKQASKQAAQDAWAAATCGQAGDVTKCTSEIGTCYGDPKATGSCSQVLACTAGCGPSGADCLSSCLKLGSPAIAAQAYAAVNCFGKNDAMCTPNVVSCLAPVGAKLCAQLTPCVLACAGKTGKDFFACQFACLVQGSTKSVTDWLNLAGCDGKCKEKCVDTNGTQCYDICMTTTCSSEQTACTPKT
ncbi:MAG: hypothetical protein EXR77_07775 [Myxococcales bacterium]|nr:hypothetical protein [Myxococcales bacterium]